MFEKTTNLDVDLHKDLKFDPSINLKFAANTATAPLAVSEVSKAMRNMPIAFSNDEPLVPVAYMSLQDGDNAFIASDGEWQGDYLPAHVRRYPFILGMTDDPDKFTVMFDADAPEVNTISGQRLYEDDGEMAPVLKDVVNLLQAFQSELTMTQDFLKPLLEKDVLTIQSITVNRPDGTNWTLNGVRAVDAERVKALDDTTIGEWVRSGLMGVIYAHLHSLENVRYLAERQGIISTEA